MSRVQSDEALKLGTVPTHRLFIVVESRRRCRLASRTLSLIKGIEACRHACVRVGWENVIRPCCFLLRFRRLRANKNQFLSDSTSDLRITHLLPPSIRHLQIQFGIYVFQNLLSSLARSGFYRVYLRDDDDRVPLHSTSNILLAVVVSVENKSRRKATESERDCLFFLLLCVSSLYF